MCGLFPCIPIFKGFTFDQKVLRDWTFNFCVKRIRWIAARYTTSKAAH